MVSGGDFIDKFIRTDQPSATVYVGMFEAVSGAAVNDKGELLYVSGGPFGRTFLPSTACT